MDLAETRLLPAKERDKIEQEITLKRQLAAQNGVPYLVLRGRMLPSHHEVDRLLGRAPLVEDVFVGAPEPSLPPVAETPESVCLSMDEYPPKSRRIEAAKEIQEVAHVGEHADSPAPCVPGVGTVGSGDTRPTVTQVTLGHATATQLDGGGSGQATALYKRRRVRIHGDASVVCYVGFTSSTAASGANGGIPLQVAGVLEFFLDETIGIWAIGASGTPIVTIYQEAFASP